MLQSQLDIFLNTPAERELCDDPASAHGSCLVAVLAVLTWLVLLLSLRAL